MTPTPAENALWRALNREPEFVPTFGMGNNGGPEWRDWRRRWLTTLECHPADRLAYFKSFAERAGYRLSVEQQDDGWSARYYNRNLLLAAVIKPTQAEAEFHAACRALAALGVIIDDVMKEIEDGQ